MTEVGDHPSEHPPLAVVPKSELTEARAANAALSERLVGLSADVSRLTSAFEDWLIEQEGYSPMDAEQVVAALRDVGEDNA